MARLNIERMERLEPERIAHAVRRIEQLGYTITLRDNKKIQFIHKGKTVTFFPYSGWATGKTIQDGRGLDKLIKQLKMDLIEQITTVATSLGWQVTSDTSVPNVVEFEFSQYTPAGQDFDFCAEMKDNDPDTLLKEIEQYYEGYDPDYEAYLWIGTDGHGKNGAPYHIKDIVSDMEAAEAMINTLYETLKTALQ